MQRKWIIPLALCILLLAAWAFRWEQGPTQTADAFKIVHIKDRWTGQAWISLYGKSNGKLYSGEMEPVPTQQSIQVRKTQILSSPEAIQYKEDLNKKIQEYQKERDLHTAGYNEGLRLVQSNKPLKWDFTGGLHSLEVMSSIPKDIYDEYIAWCEANKLLYKTTSELENQPKQAETQAESELKTWAWQKRKIATGVWVVLLALSLLTAGVFMRRSVKRNNPGK